MGKQLKQWLILFWGALKSLQMVTAAMKLKDTYSLEESYDQPRQHIEKQWRYFADKGRYSQSYGFSSSHVWMWQLDYKESWALKNWFFWTAVLDLLAVQGTLKSLLQHHSAKASILLQSAFFIVQLSHPYMTTGKTIALTRWTLWTK